MAKLLHRFFLATPTLPILEVRFSWSCIPISASAPDRHDDALSITVSGAGAVSYHPQHHPERHPADPHHIENPIAKIAQQLPGISQCSVEYDFNI